MTALDIIKQIETLPQAEQREVEEWLKRQRTLESFDEMCRISDQHSTLKHLSEEEVVSLCERESAL